MLRSLYLNHVGPAAHLRLDAIAPRFNLITGDNGLGKSFLLETAWWALTGTWHEAQAVPTKPDDAWIEFNFNTDRGVSNTRSEWDRSAQQWTRLPGLPPNAGLVLYAGIDGSFSVWDPARNYRRAHQQGEPDGPIAYRFSTDAVLDGLRHRPKGHLRDQVLCAGLIDDWTRWQDSGDPRFDLLERLLAHLGPDEQPLAPGKHVRRTISDPTRIPTVKMPYGQEVPITHAPAGVRRMAKLAYLLTWAFSEHQEVSERLGIPLSEEVIVLIDEPETHLHPRWQRTVLPSLANAIEGWSPDVRPRVQLLVATHSPLVLASMEPIFDPDRDALWKLDLVDGDVQIERDQWHARGDVNRWLTSDVFDLKAATSAGAQAALLEAQALVAK